MLVLIPLVCQHIPVFLLELAEGCFNGSDAKDAESMKKKKRNSVMAQFGSKTSAAEDSDITAIPQQLILKVVASQVFCTAVALAALGSTYQGTPLNFYLYSGHCVLHRYI